MHDLPWTFLEVWSHALTVVGWYENLPSDEIPPKWIWHDGQQLDAHFANIRKRREESLSGEAPEGDLDDVAAGSEVTLRNALVTEGFVETDRFDGWDDFTII